jgi:NhaP-type Na+/H+ and K+/H+ antiporter
MTIVKGVATLLTLALIGAIVDTTAGLTPASTFNVISNFGLGVLISHYFEGRINANR